MWIICQWCGDASPTLAAGEVVMFKEKGEVRPEWWCDLCFDQAMRENEWTGSDRPD